MGLFNWGQGRFEWGHRGRFEWGITDTEIVPDAIIGAGYVSAMAGVTVAIEASASGAGVVQTSAIQDIAVGATATGAGYVAAGAVHDLAVSATATGTGYVETRVVGEDDIPIEVSATGAGYVAAAVGPDIAVGATATGTGYVAATIESGHEAVATIAGAGYVAAAVGPDIAVGATATGTGYVAAEVQGTAAVEADVIGAGYVAATVSPDQIVAGPLTVAGPGYVAADIDVELNRSFDATTTGAGYVAARVHPDFIGVRPAAAIGAGFTELEVFILSPRIASAVGEWQVRIGDLDVSRWVQKDSVSVELRFNQRAQASFEMEIPAAECPALSVWPRRKPRPRSTVRIWWNGVDGRNSLRFTGVLYNAPVNLNPGGTWLSYSVTLPSLAARLDEVYIEGYERTIDGETIAEVINRIFLKYGRATGISTAGVVGSDVVKPEVFDYITLKEMLNRLERQSNSAWKVTPDGILQFRPRGSFDVADFTLTLANVETLELDDDLQRQRTRQIVIGGNLPSGQQSDTFTGTGNKREYQLQRRMDQIVELSVDGVSQDFGGEDDGNAWIIDQARSTVTRRAGNLPTGEVLRVLYDFEGTVVLAKQDATAVAAYGVVTNIYQDSSIESNEEGETALNRELQAHNNPTAVMRCQTLFREIPDVLDGELIPVNMPFFGISNERWLSNSVRHFSEGDTLMYDLEILAADYEELGEDYWEALKRLTTGTENLRSLTLPDGRKIDPNLLLHEGLNLPAVFGGLEFLFRRDNQWGRVPGSNIVVLDGLRLPVETVQVSFTAQVENLPPNTVGQVRLYNATDATTVGSAVEVSSTAAAPYFIRGLTLAGKTANYELQDRVTNDAPRRGGIKVWGGEIDIHHATG